MIGVSFVIGFCICFILFWVIVISDCIFDLGGE